MRSTRAGQFSAPQLSLDVRRAVAPKSNASQRINVAVMTPTEFHGEVQSLIDLWCEQRALKPLRVILNAYPLAMGLTDEWHALADALKTIRAQFRSEFSPEVLDRVIALQQFCEGVIHSPRR